MNVYLYDGVNASTVNVYKGVNACTVNVYNGVNACTVNVYNGVNTCIVNVRNAVNACIVPVFIRLYNMCIANFNTRSALLSYDGADSYRFTRNTKKNTSCGTEFELNH